MDEFATMSQLSTTSLGTGVLYITNSASNIFISFRGGDS